MLDNESTKTLPQMIGWTWTKKKCRKKEQKPNCNLYLWIGCCFFENLITIDNISGYFAQFTDKSIHVRYIYILWYTLDAYSDVR